MADDHPGGPRLESKSDSIEGEDAKVPLSFNHQLASAINQAAGTEAAENAAENSLVQRSASVEAMQVAPAEDASKLAQAFGFEGIGMVAAKRTRGRPRKDFSRSPNKHLVNTSVASKV